MLLEKIFALAVPVPDPIDYAVDPDRFLRNYLARRYAGRCLDGVRILRVVDVLQRSACLIDSTNLSAEGTVNVRFVAEVMSLGVGDIVTGVAVKRLTRVVGGSSATMGAAVVFLQSPGLEALRDGDLVSVRVALPPTFPLNQDSCEVVGTLLTCDTTAVAVEVAGALGPADHAALKSLAARVRKALAARAELPAADVDFVERLLYAYAPTGEGREKRGAWAGPAGLPGQAKPVDLLALVDGCAKSETPVTGLWRRDLAIPRSAPFATRAPAPVPGEGADAGADEGGGPARRAAEKPRQMLRQMLHETLVFLEAINTMAVTYSDPSTRDALAHVWTVMRAAQRSAP